MKAQEDVTGGVGLMANAGAEAGEAMRQESLAAAGSAGGDRSMMQTWLEMDEKNRAATSSYNTSMLDLMRDQMAERKNANKNQLLWSMAQTGLKAAGGYMTASAERKEANRARNWRRKEDEPMWDPHTGEFSKGIITG